MKKIIKSEVVFIDLLDVFMLVIIAVIVISIGMMVYTTIKSS